VPKAPRFINYLAALIAGALALIRSPRLQALQADGTGLGGTSVGRGSGVTGR
jgi:hypothetical protein